MKKFNINSSLALFLSLLIFNACHSEQNHTKESRLATLPYYQEASFTPLWLEANSDQVGALHQIPAFKLLNQNGQIITEKTFKAKIFVADFFFTTCPGICPAMTKNMNLVQDAFKDDEEVLLISHTVTPETDSIPVLKSYAEAKGVISNKWHLVTGDRELIYELGRKSYFVEEDLGFTKSSDEFLHTENFILVDHNRHIRGIYNGLNKTSVAQLIADIKTLKKEL